MSATAFSVSQLDHIALTVSDINTTVDFYTRVLGMRSRCFGNGQHSLVFRDQEINLHLHGEDLESKAAASKPGSADLCFLTCTNFNDAMRHVIAEGVEIIDGPVEKSGSSGTLISFFIHDPDKNLIEISTQID